MVRGTGELLWPVPGHRTVTSGFGIRLHPVFRVHRQHLGIDIGAPHGARVVASDTGTVITSEYDRSYGHYIVISHGNGMTTLYAHLSSRGVRRGDVVVRGDTIGRIGSTGVSTGPHLHFEVMINGSRVNPQRHL
jgi:murein DD-endopeptidase MepM/ murein hydrolase activator NlpD